MLHSTHKRGRRGEKERGVRREEEVQGGGEGGGWRKEKGEDGRGRRGEDGRNGRGGGPNSLPIICCGPRRSGRQGVHLACCLAGVYKKHEPPCVFTSQVYTAGSLAPLFRVSKGVNEERRSYLTGIICALCVTESST